jgi:PKD repeat protein
VGEKMMIKNVFRKSLVLVIIVLLIGICIQSGMSTQDIEYGNYNITDENRTSTLILRPNAAGTWNQHHHDDGSPGNQYNYQEVDEEVPDDDASYIYNGFSMNSPSFNLFDADDDYNIPDHTTETGNIISITIYVRAIDYNIGWNGWTEPSLWIGSTHYRGAKIQLRDYDYWITHSHTWSNNPATGDTWTWNDIDDLEIGTRSWGAKVTLVYAEITYEEIPLSSDANGPYSGTKCNPVQFTGTAIGGAPPYTWDWDFGDGSPHSDQQNPTHQYTNDGSYTATLTVTDNNLDTAQDTAPVTITTPTLIAEAGGPYTGTLCDSVSFTGSATGGCPPYTYSWTFGDGNTSTDQNPTHQYTSDGSYTATLTVTDNIGTIASDTASVTISTPELVADTHGPYSSTVCDPVSFTGSASGGCPPYTYYTYSWDFGDGETSNQQNPTYQYNTDDTFTVTLTVTDNVGYTDDDTTTCVITHPSLNVDAGGSYEEKVGNLVYFTGSASGGCPPYTYSWDFDDSDGIQEDSNMQNPTHAYQNPGSYTVTLTVTDSKYYTSIDTATATITPLEVEADAGGPYYGGVDVPIQFTGNAYEGSPPYEYYWDFGDGENSDEKDPTHIYNEPSPPGGYEVFLTVTDSESNLDWDNTYAYVSSDIENPTANAGGPYNGYINQGIQFLGDAFGGTPPYSFSWDFDDSDGIQIDSTEQNPLYTYTDEGEYIVTLIVTDDNGKTDDDTTTASVSKSMPDLNCMGALSWTGVKPGETKTGTITVENIGGSGTLLDWQVESTIEWGDWTFTPESGEDLTPEDEPVTIMVTVIAPDEKNTEFTGEIYLVNKNNPQDKCTITISLTTLKTKTIDTILLRLLENYPLIYQLIQLFFKL